MVEVSLLRLLLISDSYIRQQADLQLLDTSVTADRYSSHGHNRHHQNINNIGRLIIWRYYFVLTYAPDHNENRLFLLREMKITTPRQRLWISCEAVMIILLNSYLSLRLIVAISVLFSLVKIRLYHYILYFKRSLLWYTWCFSDYASFWDCYDEPLVAHFLASPLAPRHFALPLFSLLIAAR